MSKPPEKEKFRTFGLRQQLGLIQVLPFLILQYQDQLYMFRLILLLLLLHVEVLVFLDWLFGVLLLSLRLQGLMLLRLRCQLRQRLELGRELQQI